MRPQAIVASERQPVIHVNILFLGPSRDGSGVDSAAVELNEAATVGDLRREIESRFVGLRDRTSTMRIAVNNSFVPDEHVLKEGDEVALIPPVSGGSSDEPIWIELTKDAIPRERIHSFVGCDNLLGGIVAFDGVTRAETDAEHGDLIHLYYEAYQDMASKQLRSLADEAVQRWGVERIAILHRIGAVSPGDASVSIAVASAHRAEAFEACRFLIDRLKQDVPIWKKDVFADGFERWVEPAATGSGDTE